jgi:alpha-amylase
LAWDQSAIAGSDHEFGGKGHPDTGADFWGAPDIDHTKDFVREGLTGWLRWLREEVGFEGWRFDYAKGYGSR